MRRLEKLNNDKLPDNAILCAQWTILRPMRISTAMSHGCNFAEFLNNILEQKIQYLIFHDL